MTGQTQEQKAAGFRQQHQGGKLLILPNVWDVLSAKLVADSGFSAVATASIATAISNGYHDGEKIPFPELLKVVQNISKAVSVPVSVDMERGFADTKEQLKDHIKALIDHGAAGLNIEDGKPGYQGFDTIAEMCGKIEAIKEAGIQSGVPVFINVRTDIFIQKPEGDKVMMAAERANAYRKAGADGIYPILINSYEDIAAFLAQVNMPVNVALIKPIADLKKLEAMGVARVSLGPQLFGYALAKIKKVAGRLAQYDHTELFAEENLGNDTLANLV